MKQLFTSNFWQKKTKIFIGVLEIAGYYNALNQLFQENGYRSDLFILFPDKFSYLSNSRQPKISIYIQSLAARYTRSNYLGKITFGFLHLFFTSLVLLYAIVTYNVFIFSYGKTFYPRNLDLLLLKFFRKKIIINIGHGDEARSLLLSGGLTFELNGPKDIKKLLKKEYYLINKIKFLEKYSSYVIALPTTCHYLTRDALNFQKIAGLVRIPEIKINKCFNKKFTITHIPSNPKVKGSAIIKNICEDLIKKYPEIIYKSLEGISNKVVLEQFAESHIVVDQLWSDLPLSKTGMECAQLKVICIAGTYAISFWKENLDDNYKVNSLLIHPEELYLKLEDIYLNYSKYEKNLEIINNNVLKVWSKEKILEVFLNLFENKLPHSIMFNPKKTKYYFGCGISKIEIYQRSMLLIEYFRAQPIKRYNLIKKMAENITIEIFKTF